MFLKLLLIWAILTGGFHYASPFSWKVEVSEDVHSDSVAVARDQFQGCPDAGWYSPLSNGLCFAVEGSERQFGCGSLWEVRPVPFGSVAELGCAMYARSSGSWAFDVYHVDVFQ